MASRGMDRWGGLEWSGVEWRGVEGGGGGGWRGVEGGGGGLRSARMRAFSNVPSFSFITSKNENKSL
jgi:hypothetical protein